MKKSELKRQKEVLIDNITRIYSELATMRGDYCKAMQELEKIEENSSNDYEKEIIKRCKDVVRLCFE